MDADCESQIRRTPVSGSAAGPWTRPGVASGLHRLSTAADLHLRPRSPMKMPWPPSTVPHLACVAQHDGRLSIAAALHHPTLSPMDVPKPYTRPRAVTHAGVQTIHQLVYQPTRSLTYECPGHLASAHVLSPIDVPKPYGCTSSHALRLRQALECFSPIGAQYALTHGGAQAAVELEHSGLVQ